MTDCYAGGSDWYRNDKKFTNFDNGFYATDAFTDVAIEFLKEHENDGQPDLLFLAYNAPHHPCQAPQASVEKYSDRYAAGYDTIRAARLERQRQLGLIDTDFVPADHGAEARRWNELQKKRKKIVAQRMAAYAAMMDEVDQNIGKLLAYLKDSGRFDNTIIVFVSDNGGDYSNGSPLSDAKQIPWQAGSNPTPSNGLAWVKNTPFRSYKHSSYEGALASPLIVHWPSSLADHAEVRDALIDEPTHITDLYPTLLELAHATHPKQHGNKQLLPLAGASLMPLLHGGPWQLFNLQDDRGETTDLAAAHPDKLDNYVAKWHARAEPDTPYSHPLPQDPQPRWGWHRIQRITGYAENDEPFFLAYWTYDVHAPYQGKDDLQQKYRDRAESLGPDDPQRNPTMGAMIENLDQNMGKLLDHLDELDIADNTLVVFTSDNGGNMYDRPNDLPPTNNAPLRGGKGNIYEGGVRVPTIVR